MASTPLANPLVGVIDGRVVHGHIVATLNTRAKEELVQRFYAADTTPAERSELLREAGATLVAFGPRERALGALDLSSLPGLDLQYDAGGVQVFRVR
jgi:hypothetical protein